MQPGIYDNLTNHQYHAGPGESKSLLDLVRRSPAHYRARMLAANDDTPPAATPAQMIGTAFHALLLEPGEFAKNYCLALRPQDVPEAVDDREAIVAMVQELNAQREAAHPGAVKDRDQLLAMVAELNKGRLPKLPTGGSKDELVARIQNAQAEAGVGNATLEELQAMKLADLKSHIEILNQHRPGLISTSGSMPELAATLRANGVDVVLWSEILERHQAEHGVPYIGNTTTASRHDMAQWLRANGRPITLWSDVLQQWLQNNGHRQVLTMEQWDQLHRMRDAVMAHPAAAALLTGAPGVAERSVYWRDPATGLLCRCRPDFWRQDGIVVDVKTTEDASAEGFAKSIAHWRYHVQAPFYLDGINHMRDQYKPTGLDLPMPPAAARAFVFLAVEKSAQVVDGVSMGVGVYVLDQESMALGRIEYEQDLQRIADCRRAGVWPGYGDKIQPIELPKWKLAQSAHLLADAA